MTLQHKDLHERFLNFRSRFREFELEFIKLLQETERIKLHRALGCASVFKYAVDILNFSESVAYMYIAVARKALEFPELLESGLTVSKASRIVAALEPANAAYLIRFALEHSSRQIDREVARLCPKAGREKFKCLSDEFFALEFRASRDFPELLARAQSLLAQRGLDAGMGPALEAGLRELIRKFDPVQKAARAERRKAGRSADKSVTEFCANRVPRKREPLTAAQKHAVFARDKGRCTFQLGNGKVCGSDRWVEIHHIREVRNGGSNEPENLTTLCSIHHELVHQLSFPLDGQVSWLRARAVGYG